MKKFINYLLYIFIISLIGSCYRYDTKDFKKDTLLNYNKSIVLDKFNPVFDEGYYIILAKPNIDSSYSTIYVKITAIEYGNVNLLEKIDTTKLMNIPYNIKVDNSIESLSNYEGGTIVKILDKEISRISNNSSNTRQVYIKYQTGRSYFIKKITVLDSELRNYIEGDIIR